MKKPILLFLAVMFSQLCFAQHEGILRLQVSPRFAWVRIDTIVTKPTPESLPVYQMRLPAGTYRVDVWAPGFLLLSDSVTIEAGKSTDYIKGLTALNPEFAAYRKEVNRYLTGKFFRNTSMGLSGLASAGFLIWTFSNPKVKQYKEQAILASERYRNAVVAEEIATSKEVFQRYAALYEDAQKTRNTKYFIGIPSAIVTGGFTYWLYNKYKKNPLKKPRYDEKNPFVFMPLIESAPDGWTSVGFRLDF